MKNIFALVIAGMMVLSCVENKNNVYICTGSSSQCYHKEKDCKGLRYCKANIKEISLEDAEEIGRRPCKICHR